MFTNRRYIGAGRKPEHTIPMSIQRPSRANSKIMMAVNFLVPEIHMVDDDPSTAKFVAVFVNNQMKTTRVRCTAKVYERIKGKFVARKGFTGLKDQLQSMFRLVVEAKGGEDRSIKTDHRGIVTAIDMVPEQTVLHRMRRKDLEGVDTIKFELTPDGGMRVVQRPQDVTMQQVLHLMTNMDNVMDFAAGDMFGNHEVLSAEGRFLELSTAEVAEE